MEWFGNVHIALEILCKQTHSDNSFMTFWVANGYIGRQRCRCDRMRNQCNRWQRVVLQACESLLLEKSRVSERKFGDTRSQTFARSIQLIWLERSVCSRNCRHACASAFDEKDNFGPPILGLTEVNWEGPTVCADPIKLLRQEKSEDSGEACGIGAIWGPSFRSWFTENITGADT